MTKEYIKNIADYNLWANSKFIDWCSTLTDVQWTTKIKSSFSSIPDTIIHIAGAELIWVDRFEGKENPRWIPSIFNGSQVETLSLLATSSLRLKHYYYELDEKQYQDIIEYKRLNGNIQSSKQLQLMIHVINHGTYHRGQLVTMLRQIGFEGISSTDFMEYIQNKKETES